jgi:hypothetical protein
MPDQYPAMRTKPTVANLVNSMGDLDMDDDEDTDDELMTTKAFMVCSRTSMDPPTGLPDTQYTPDPPTDILEVRAHFEYGHTIIPKGSVYAISDGGQTHVSLERMLRSSHTLEGMLTWLDMTQKLQGLKESQL